MSFARQIIEAEDPKSVLRKASGFVTFDRLKEILEPQGWRAREQLGAWGMEKTKTPAAGTGLFYYFVTPSSDGGADIAMYRDYGDGKGLLFHERVHSSNLQYLMNHLRLFRIAEAEDPKSVFRSATSRMDIKNTRSSATITDGRGNTIMVDYTFGTPTIGWLRYVSGEENVEDRVAAGSRLLKAAYDLMRKQNDYRVKVATRTSRYTWHGQHWDLNADDPAEIGNLIHSVEPECYTGASGQVRYITLESVLALDPGGGLKLTAKPKAPHSIWTHRRRTEFGEPNPYHRVRTLPGGKPLEIYAAYRKDQAPTKLLSLAKKYGPHVAKMSHWAADDLTAVLQDKGITAVIAMPSAEPLARRLARLLANRLGVPLQSGVEKTGSVRTIPIAHRKAVAPRFFNVEGKFRGQTVLLVDDYVVTSASLMAVAGHIYAAGARKVLAAAFAI